MWRALPLVLLLACGNKNQPKPTEEAATEEDGATEEGTEGTEADGEEGATEGEGTGGTDAGAEATNEKPTPESLYAECKERMELPQSEGECTKDEDCITAGCGGEVCSTAAAKDMSWTCIDKPCFHVADTCGCHEGQCTWTLKDELPEMNKLPPAPLPPNRLPPTPPPPAEDGGDAGSAPAEEKSEAGAE